MPAPSTVDAPRAAGAARPAPGASAPSSPGSLLQDRLAALRRRVVGVRAWTGLATAAVVAVELLALAMFLDWWLELPWGVRLISLLLQAAVVGTLLMREVVLPLLRQPDEEELALMVEKARPEFRTRLIASLQLARPGGLTPGSSPALVAALVTETEELARPGDFRAIVPTDRLKRFGALALLILLIAGAGFAAGRETCADLLRRVFLSSVPVPRKTRIVVPEGDRVVGIGDTVRLDALVQGILPAHGKVLIRPRNRRGQEFPLEQNREKPAQFGRTLENVQDSFTYQFQLGDGVSPTFTVTAVPRPTVASVECQQQFPAYTGLLPARRSLGDLTLLAGSVLRLQATATKDLRGATLRLVGVNQAIPLQLDPAKPRALTGQFTIPARGLTGFQIDLVDTEGMESRDNAVYRVDVLPDKAPVARLTHPDRKEELVTRVATLLVAFEASDDFQIAKVRLRFKADTVDNGEVKTVELEPGDGPANRLRRRYDWKIPAHLPGLTEGSLIEYWIEVEDNNNATGPGITSTDHQLAKVVSDAEKRADLLNRAGDYLGSISDVAGDQEKLNRSLGEIIKAKTGIP